MRILNITTHPDLDHLDNKKILQRNATRAIVLKGEDILLLYTERYHDYSLPGGGIDEGEDVIAGLVREIKKKKPALRISLILSRSVSMKNSVLGISMSVMCCT